MASPRVRVVATGPRAIRVGLEFLRARPDRRISLVDALSFATMRSLGITTAFTLDSDFAAEGFALLPV
jgi:predicted nucleic acid-binding protein